MKVKIVNSVVGIGFSFQPGQIVDLPKELAVDLISAGHAVRAVEDARKRSKNAAVHPAAKKGRRE